MLTALAFSLVGACGSAQWRTTSTPESTPTPSPTPTTLDLESRNHRFGALTMRSGFVPDPYSISGTSGGDVNVSYVGASPTGPCTGWAGATPNHLLTLESNFDYLRLRIESQGDTTLLVHGPGGWLCSDDADGLDPVVEGSLSAGTYHLWVGTAGGAAGHPYDLSITQVPPEPAEPSPASTPPPEPVVAPDALDTESWTSRYGNVGLNAGFRPDPVTLDGRAEGQVDASYLGYTAAGPCRGLTQRAPSHVMTLHTDFDYLRIDAESAGAVALVVHGPSGWMCSDGEEASAPSLEGPFSAGTYRIWVAELGWSGASAYRLSFSQDQPSWSGPVTLDTEQFYSRYATLALSPGFVPDPQSVTGRSGGEVDASYIGYTALGPCVGYTQVTASHTLSLSGGLDRLRLDVDSPGDTTLLVYGPDGWRCTDDTVGVNPAIEDRFVAGTYRIWVGSHEPGRAFDYTLTVSSAGPPVDMGRLLDVTSNRPRHGRLDLRPGFWPDPTTLAGVTGGSTEVSMLGHTATGACEGYTDWRPSHLLSVEGEIPRLELEAVGASDLTLLVYGPRGWLCSSGRSGRGPAIDASFPPGTYRIWVGGLSPMARREYTLYIGSGSPPRPWPAELDASSWEARHGGLNLNPGAAMPPHTLEGTSGGTVDGSYLGQTDSGPCRGFTETTPNHILTLQGQADYLSLEVQAQVDTTLLVLGPAGWLCNDDAVGLQPRIEGSFPAGNYRIWVGSYRQGDEQTYTLRLTQSASHEPAPLGLDTSAGHSRYQSIGLEPGFLPDPQLLWGRAGGPVDTRVAGFSPSGACVGYADATPDHIITLSRPFSYLRFDVQSEGDTTLLIHGPEGWLCNDDAVGVQPRIEGAFRPGAYRIWVGTYHPGTSLDYTLNLSERAAF